MSLKDQYHARKAAGLCSRCGREKENLEYVNCRRCRVYMSSLYQTNRERIDRAITATKDRTLTGLFEAMIRGGKCYVLEYDI